jgi:hypothetical protein
VIESQYQSSGTNTLTIHFRIVNPSINLGTEVPLKNVKVRYYFNTATSPAAFSSACDSAAIDSPYAPICSELTITEGTSPGTTAQAANGTYYLEFAFPTATQSIPTADGSATMNIRYYPSNYASGTFTPTTDYSYLVGDGGYVANPNMTATLNDVLVWGKTP